MEKFNFLESNQLFSTPYGKTKNLFLVKNGWILFAIIFLQLFFIKILGPKLMAFRKPFDLRPFMLVLNGLNFGTLGCGIIVFSYVLNFCKDSWKCENNLRKNHLQEWAMIYSAYLYLLMKIGDNVSFMLMILRKKSNQQPWPMAVYNNCSILLAFLGLKYHPVDIFMLHPYLETWRGSLRYAYYTLKTPPTSSCKYKLFRKFIIASCLLFDVINIIHMFYLLSNGCAPSPFLMYGLILLSIGELAYLLIKHSRRMFVSAQTSVKVD